MQKGQTGLKATADTGYGKLHNLRILMMIFLEGVFDIYMVKIRHLHEIYMTFTLSLVEIYSQLRMGHQDRHLHGLFRYQVLRLQLRVRQVRPEPLHVRHGMKILLQDRNLELLYLLQRSL